MSDASSNEWDDDEELTDLDDEEGLDVSEEELNEAMSELHKSIFENKVISTFVKNAYDFGGTNTLLEVVNCVERKMGWRAELVADRAALDDYMLYRFETFDEEIWEHYLNSDEYQELIYDVAHMSQQSLYRFADKYSVGTSPKQMLRNRVRNMLWRLYKKF
jgi:hypothetical protein